MTRFAYSLSIATLVVLFAATFAATIPARTASVQDASPTPPWSCDDLQDEATPGGDHMGMDMATPGADHGGMDMDMSMSMDIDLMYIDMMIAHHSSVIALAEVALARLTDERVIEIAENIIKAQTAENAELRGYREDLYGSAKEMPMGEQMMDLMSEMMPGAGSMADMSFQMNAEAQVRAFCGQDNPDLAFIDMVIPHHEMAVVTSEAVVANGTHPEIIMFAKRVITDQTAEIAVLKAIRDKIAA